MNVKEYISSGIVESYVLGLATEQERAEFEKYCAEYREVLEARNAFEQLLEQRAMENAIAPSKDVKNKIWNTIQNDKAKIVSISKSEKPVRQMSWRRYAVAASLILLAGSAYWNYQLYNQNKKLKQDNSSYVARIADIEKDLSVIQNNPNIKMASMKGMEPSPNSFTTVYWDTTSHDVYIMVNNLPKPASDKQYQIWALLDGKPIDLGLIENDLFIRQRRLLVKAKNVDKAQAFAITLEKKGGNLTPEGKIYVLGNL